MLDVPVLSLSVLTPDEVKRASSSTSPPVTGEQTDDGLYDEGDDWVSEVVHVVTSLAVFRSKTT